jgi:integrase
MSDLTNPVEHIRMPKNRAGRERRLKQWEEEALYKELKPPYLQAVQLALETALRRSELCKLQWEDVNLKKYVALVRDTKNGEDRVIPLSPTAIAILESLPRTSTTVLDISSPDTLTWFFRQACKEALIKDLTFHDLRHEAVSRLVEGRLFELAEIMQISGHKTLSAFNTYMHSRAEKLAERMRGTKQAQ